MRCLTYAELEREHGVPNDAEFFEYDGHEDRCVAFFDGDVEWGGDVDEATVRRWLSQAGETPAGLVVLGVRGSLRVSGDLLAASYLGVAPAGTTNDMGFGLYVLGDVSATNMTLGSEHVSALVLGETHLRGGLFLVGNGTMMELCGPVRTRFVVDPHSCPVLFDESAIEHVIREDDDVPSELRETAFENGAFDPQRFYESLRAEGVAPADPAPPAVVSPDLRRPANLVLEDAERALLELDLDAAATSAEQVLGERPGDRRATTVLARALFASDRARSEQLARSAAAESDRCASLVSLHELVWTPSADDSEAERLFQAGKAAFLELRHEEAARAWLDSLTRSRALRDDGARRALIALFDWLGSDDPITRDFRRQLMFAL